MTYVPIARCLTTLFKLFMAQNLKNRTHSFKNQTTGIKFDTHRVYKVKATNNYAARCETESSMGKHETTRQNQ